ncbi:MAG: glycosyltransferase family 39 protein [Candidatus Coatesbacteria bacterium]
MIGLIFLAAIGLGTIFARWTTRHGSLFESVVLGLPAAGASCVGLGLVGLTYPPLAAAICILGILGLVCRPANIRHLVGTLGAAGNETMNSGPAGWISLTVALLVTAYSFELSLVPPTMYDSLAYHLLLPQQQMFAHKVFDMPYFMPSAFPFLVHGEYLWTMLLGLDWHGAAFLNWLHAPLSAIAVYRIAVTIGLPGAAAIAAAAAWLGTPMVLITGATPLTDLQAGLYALLGVEAFLRWWQRPAGLRALAGAGFWCGLGAACKYNGGLVIIPIVAGVAVMRGSPLRRVVRILVVGGASAIPILPVLLKNELFTGAPLFPFLTHTEPHDKWAAWNLALYTTDRSWISAVLLPARVIRDWREVFSKDLSQVGASLAAVYAAPLVCAYAWRQSRRPGQHPVIQWPRGRTVIWLTGAILFLYLIAFRADWSLRYLMPVLGLCVVYWMIAASLIPFGLLVALALLLSANVFCLDIGGFRSAYRTANWQERAYLTNGPMIRYLFPALDYIDRNLAPSVRVLGVFEPRLFYARRRCLTGLMHDRSIIVDALHRSTDAPHVRKCLKQRAVTHVLVWPDPPREPASQFLWGVSPRERALLNVFFNTETTVLFRYPAGPHLVLRLNAAHD